MKLPRWIPNPESWLSAVALYFFGMGVTIVFGMVFPWVFDLIDRAPRLGWFALLLVWLSPIPAAAAIHAFVHGILDAADREKKAKRSSRFAGLFAWMAWMFTTVVASLIMLVIDPPPPDDGALSTAVHLLQRSSTVSVFGLVWIVVAAFVYRIESSARP
jgi:hypothetical protein